MRQVRCMGWLAGLWLAAVSVGFAEEPVDSRGSPLAATLSEDGWELAPGVRVQLRTSSLTSLSPLTVESLEALAGRRGWTRFADASRLAPVNVTIVPQEVEGRRVGHLVTARFTLRAAVADFERNEQVQRSLGLHADTDEASFRQLTQAELAAAGIVPAADDSEQYAVVQVLVLNRIEVRGVIRVERQQTPRGLLLAWAFDHRFDALPELRSRSSRMSTNDLGAREAEAAVPYAGCAGIVVARELTTDERRAAGETTVEGPLMVVESLLTVAEPEAWFGGSNLLRAKIPLITQEGVRDLRRRLEAARRAP